MANLNQADLDQADLNQSLPEALDIWQHLGWSPSSEQQSAYQTLYQMILQGNQQLNLTRITEPTEFWEKHLWDSLRGIQPWLVKSGLDTTSSSSLQLIDIGTGAGFPGLPVAIACPDWQITLLDSTRKKIVFLQTVIDVLKLSARTVVDRAEQLGQLPQHRAIYDIATIRAVASASVCAEYALPLIKLGGVAVLYRGQWLDEETAGLRLALPQLGGEIQQIDRFVTPLSHSVRHCIYLKKVAPTPLRFPRPVGVPNQNPL